jgi:hypothetical protein
MVPRPIVLAFALLYSAVVCSAADYFVSYSCTSHNVQNRDHDVFVTFVDDAGVSTSKYLLGSSFPAGGQQHAARDSQHNHDTHSSSKVTGARVYVKA